MKANYILEGKMKRVIAGIVMMLTALVMCWAEVVVVPPFQDRDSGLRVTDILNVTDSLINAVYQTGRFEVPDRDAQALQLAEAKFQMSDWADERKTIEMSKVLNADYLVRGVVSPESDGSYYVFVRLLNGSTTKVLGTAERNCKNLREIRDQIDSIVKELLDDIRTVRETVQQQQRTQLAAQQMQDAWKNKRIYFGLRGGGNVGFFGDGSGPFSEGKEKAEFNFAFSFLVQTNDYFAIQTELLYMQDRFETYPDDSLGAMSADTVLVDSFMLPILLKGTFRPSIFSIGALAGIYFKIPLYVSTYTGFDLYSSVLGGMVGADFGVKAGIGIVKLDLRYAFDFGTTELSGDYVIADFGTRSMFLFTIGYEIGLKDRKLDKAWRLPTSKLPVSQYRLDR
ncbi:hypothetical protein AGMMS50255_1120 [Spirochaetia bacterium]|nr:hypothetical protein AGMMS50255_1120 [Spirochaetia bacterium]